MEQEEQGDKGIHFDTILMSTVVGEEKNCLCFVNMRDTIVRVKHKPVILQF